MNLPEPMPPSEIIDRIKDLKKFYRGLECSNIYELFCHPPISCTVDSENPFLIYVNESSQGLWSLDLSSMEKRQFEAEPKMSYPKMTHIKNVGLIGLKNTRRAKNKAILDGELFFIKTKKPVFPQKRFSSLWKLGPNQLILGSRKGIFSVDLAASRLEQVAHISLDEPILCCPYKKNWLVVETSFINKPESAGFVRITMFSDQFDILQTKTFDRCFCLSALPDGSDLYLPLRVPLNSGFKSGLLKISLDDFNTHYFQDTQWSNFTSSTEITTGPLKEFVFFGWIPHAIRPKATGSIWKKRP